MYRKKLLDYKSFHSTVLNSIKTTLFEKSNETEEHAERMAGMAKQLGQVLGLDQEELVALELATTLHDIGKISIDSKLLQKNGQLTDDEWLEVRKHPEVGYRIAQTVPELRKISEYILCHHERWDGTGYPQGLKTDEIPLLARILAIVDAYDAMTRDRPYRKAMTKKDAIDELKRNSV
jgi:HD-GYP domain-containing protein (c-di-GMP phosphodiesterase class II)